MSTAFFGFINLNKPSGMSSFEAVKEIKKFTGQKAGHMGTLDPDATGVLPVAIGRATKLIPYVKIDRKVYLARATFGANTDTLDSSGKILQEKEYGHITKEKLVIALENFTGIIEQIPPKFSALKYNGKRYYQLARQGIEVEDPPERKVRIDKIELLDFSLPIVEMKIFCSGGTYIRSLARDIGLALDSFAHLSGLKRLQDGPFKISDSISLDEAEENLRKYIIPPEEILNYPVLEFNKADTDKMQNGVFLSADKKILENAKGEYFFAKGINNELVALCRIVEEKSIFLIKACRVF